MNDRAVRPSAALWSGAALLMLLPALAMRFSSAIRWGAEDFAALALLLLMGCGGIEGARRLHQPLRTAALVAVPAACVLVWALLATAD